MNRQVELIQSALTTLLRVTEEEGGWPRKISDRGISLIEIMVALFIVGLMTSLMIMTFPTTKSELEKSLMQLKDNIESTRREAVVSGSTLQIRIDEEGYVFEKWHGSIWTEYKLGSRPVSVKWSLPVMVENLRDDSVFRPDDDAQNKSLRIRIDPTSSMTDIHSRFSTSTEAFVLRNAEDGEILIDDENEQSFQF